MKKNTKLTLTAFGIALSVFLIPTTVVFIVHGTDFFSHWRLGEWLQYSGVLTSAAVSLWLGLRAYNQNEYSRRANLQRPCFGIKKVIKIDGEKESQVEFSVNSFKGEMQKGEKAYVILENIGQGVANDVEISINGATYNNVVFDEDDDEDFVFYVAPNSEMHLDLIALYNHLSQKDKDKQKDAKIKIDYKNMIGFGYKQKFVIKFEQQRNLNFSVFLLSSQKEKD